MEDQALQKDADGELVVTTPLLTILHDIQREQAAGFSALQTALNNKVDKADMARVETRMEGQFQEHHRRISELEGQERERALTAGVRQENRTQILTKRQKFWGAVGVAFLGFCGLASPVISHFINFH